MKPRVYVAVATTALASIVLLRHLDIEPVVEREDIVGKLPYEIQVLLPDGLCDNLHNVFLMEVAQFASLPNDKRAEALERVEYYREWLRRKGCG